MVNSFQDVDDKFVNNIISYFSETNLTDRFKSAFLDELKTDVVFQEKIKALLDSEGVTPGDEVLWRKIIDSENLLSDMTKEKLFLRFGDLLKQILQKTNSSNDASKS